MGIERFYTLSIAVYGAVTASTHPFDITWAQITGSPFKGSFTETSGDRAKVGGATEARADGYFCLPIYNHDQELYPSDTLYPSDLLFPNEPITEIETKYKIKYDSRNFDIVQIKILPEKAGHHQEVYVRENKEVVLP